MSEKIYVIVPEGIQVRSAFTDEEQVVIVHDKWCPPGTVYVAPESMVREVANKVLVEMGFPDLRFRVVMTD